MLCSEKVSKTDFPCRPAGQVYKSCLVSARPGDNQVKFDASMESCDCSTTSPCEMLSIVVPVNTSEAPAVCTEYIEEEKDVWKKKVDDVTADCNVDVRAAQAACTRQMEAQEEACDEKVREAERPIKAECDARLGEEDAKCEERKEVNEKELMDMKDEAVKKASEQCESDLKEAEACSGKFKFSVRQLKDVRRTL